MKKWLDKNEKETEAINTNLNSVKANRDSRQSLFTIFRRPYSITHSDELAKLQSEEMAKSNEMKNREAQKEEAKRMAKLAEMQKTARQKVAILEIQHWLWTQKYNAMKKKKKKGKGL